MRKVEKYSKKNCSQKQKEKLEIINKFQDDIAKCFFNTIIKSKN